MKIQTKPNALPTSILQSKELRKRQFGTVHKREVEMLKQFQLNRKRIKSR